jgi:hypothetical protein
MTMRKLMEASGNISDKIIPETKPLDNSDSGSFTSDQTHDTSTEESTKPADYTYSSGTVIEQKQVTAIENTKLFSYTDPGSLDPEDAA